MPTKFTHAELAVFGEGNIQRVEEIVDAKGDSKELAKISPSFIVMDLTWKCNYHCSICIDKEAVNKQSKNLPIEIIEDIFDYSNRKNVRGIMTMGGEVFLYEEGMRTALEKSIEYQIPLKTVSNGSRLKPLLDQIINAYKIPGSMLRVSINSTKKNYKSQTRGQTNLEEILENIKKITSRGARVFVSTVVFPESSRENKAIPNIMNLNEIIMDCKNAGIRSQILIPARNPQTRSRYILTEEEEKIIEKTKKKDYGFNVEMGSFNKEEIYRNQDSDFHPCPSGFIFTLIGSDGKIYKCTDNRGRENMVLGKIKEPGDFEKFWHSTERVEKQKQIICPNKGCIRYKTNVILNAACETYQERGVSMVKNLGLIGGEYTIYE